MSDAPDRIDETELHALADGQLPAEREAAVRAWLDAHPEDAARVAAWQAQTQAIRAEWDAVAEEPIPERLDVRRLAGGGGGTGSAWRMALAASILALVVGAGAGWFGHGYRDAMGEDSVRFASEAITAHEVFAVEVRHPVEVGADEEAHLVKWLTKRIGGTVRAPNLQSAGFHLVGGRLLSSDHGPAAQLMYEDEGGRRLTLYATRSAQSQETAFRYQVHGKTGAFYWLDGKLGYALIGEVDREELLQLARLCYEQYEAPG
jgi:anti-sigma factor RsiW